MRRYAITLLAWYFAIYHYGGHTIGPFATEVACEEERKSQARYYSGSAISPKCWEGPVR